MGLILEARGTPLLGLQGIVQTVRLVFGQMDQTLYQTFR